MQTGIKTLNIDDTIWKCMNYKETKNLNVLMVIQNPMVCTYSNYTGKARN